MTVRQYFNSLPEPYRTKALKNMDGNQQHEDIGDSPDSMSYIFHGFFTMDIPERWQYWDNFQTYLFVKRIIDAYAEKMEIK